MTATSAKGFDITVSEDGLSATLTVMAGITLEAALVLAKLVELKIQGFNPAVITDALQKRGDGLLSIVVASGKAPVASRPGRVELKVPANHTAAGGITRVDNGQLVATITAGAAGVDGCDVLGQPVPHQIVEPAIKPGKNLRCSKSNIFATMAGNLRLIGGVLSVAPLLEMVEDQTFAAVNFDGDVMLKGTLRSDRVVRATGSFSVIGSVEAARIDVQGALVVKGGITGQLRGKCLVGGDLSCRFISAGMLIVGGDVHIESEISNSRIACAGKITVAHGNITGGEIIAGGGIICQFLGHSSRHATTLEVGTDQMARVLATTRGPEIKLLRSRACELRAKLEPLARNLEQLSAHQQDQLKRLLGEAEALETRADQLTAQLKAFDQSQRQNRNEILVHQMAYPGVTVRFPGATAVIGTILKGPLKLLPKTRGQTTDIFMVDQKTGKSTMFQSLPQAA
jgi:uncharacterized protein (DUF342 family)